MDHLHDAGTLIAKAIQAKSGEIHGGWAKYTAGGDAAVCALLEAGWTPPGEGTETERLRATVLHEQDLARQAWEHVARLDADLEAAGEFRMKFLGIWMALRDGFAQRTVQARISHEPEPMYTGEQVMKWLDNMLDRSDKAAGRAKTKSLAAKQAEKPATTDGPDALFDAAS